MSEVFISYARTSVAHAERIAEALRNAGYGVWRDDELPAHRDYSEVIEERLRAAKAVLVIWSADAVKSQWVRAEADIAREAGTLVQLTVDQAPLPMPFNRIQLADLTGWTGDLAAPGWRKVAASVAELAGRTTGVPASPSPATSEDVSGAGRRPAIAVMPFTDLTNDPEQAYFVAGVVEEIVAALSRFKALHVVSAGASLMSQGRQLSPQELARNVGARFLLEGSVRKAGPRVRISLHMIDGANGAELWTDRVDDADGDVFALQDLVAERVAGIAEMTVHDAETRRAVERPTSHLGSYDLYLRAVFLFRVSRREEMAQAIELLDRAVALDPMFALGLSQIAVCLRQQVDHDWTDAPDAARRKGLEHAERALRVAASDPRVLSQVAISLPGLEGRTDRALTLIERAKGLNPNSGFVWLASGSLLLRHGDPEAAAADLETAMRLDAISSMNNFMRMYLACARFQQRRFDEALALFHSTTYRLPVSFVILASLHGHLGQPDEASRALADLESVCAGSVERLAGIWFSRPEYRELLFDGLALARGEATA